VSDWDECAVIELANNKRERFNDGDWIETPYITSSGTRLLQTGNIGIGKLLNTGTKRYISDQSFRLLKCKEVLLDDILICRLADPAGRACLVRNIGEKRMITSVDVTIYRPDPRKVDRRFMVAMFSTNAWFREVNERCGGSTRTRIARSELGRIRLRIPRLEEQSHIADALSDADASITALERLITKKQAIKQGMMQELLTGRTQLPGFTRPWKTTRLGDVLAVRHGKSQRGIELPSGRFPILATGGQIGWTDTPLYNKPSVLIGRKGTIDRPQYQERPFWTIDTLFYTEIASSADPKFLYYVFLTIDWRSLNEASGVPSLSASRVESLSVELPGIDEQKAIRSVLDDAEEDLRMLNLRVNKARDVKQGMMQELLTGRTRLPVEEAVA